MTPLESLLSLRDRLIKKGIKDQFLEELLVLEKTIKALGIIRKHIKNIACRVFSDGYELELTKEEFDLLKEMLL